MNEITKPNVFPLEKQPAVEKPVVQGISPAEQAAINQMKENNERLLREREERLKNVVTEVKPEIKNENGGLVVKPPKGYRPPIDTTHIPYDLVPLPSEGKIYPFRKPNLKVAYLTATDEDILTSPKILESGEWLDILINRKILDDIDAKDLHIGDRMAILLWLRATGYGPIYPINVINPKTGRVIIDPVTKKPFIHDVDLTELKIKKLGAEPDNNGLFNYTFPICKKSIKFKLLTVRDIEELNEIEKYELEVLKLEFSNGVTNRLRRQIVEIDGINDIDYIDSIIAVLPPRDFSDFRGYSDEIESGVDLRLEVGIPGGESISTFLTLNVNFFWPNIRL